MMYCGYELRHGCIDTKYGKVGGVLIIKGDKQTIAENMEVAKRYVDSKVSKKQIPILEKAAEASGN